MAACEPHRRRRQPVQGLLQVVVGLLAVCPRQGVLLDHLRQGFLP